MKFEFVKNLETWEAIDKKIGDEPLSGVIHSRLQFLLSRFNPSCADKEKSEQIPLLVKRYTEIYDEDLSLKLKCAAESLGIKPVQFINIFVISQLAADIFVNIPTKQD